jgi:peptidoglycan/LPS O-acetylase OafA/YrhL
MVMVFHMDRQVVWPPSWVGTTLPMPLACLRAGHTAVTLFFVLSAFLLALPFLAEADGGRHIRVRDYLQRRALRVLPLYWAAVCVGTALSARTAADLLRGLPYLLFLNAAYGWFTPLEPYSTVWWSLVTEMEFYLVLPVVVIARRSPMGRRLGVAALGLYALAYGAFLVGRVHMASIGGQVHLIVSVFGFGPVFLCGIAAAALYRRYGEALRSKLWGRPWVRNGGADLALLAVVVGLGRLLQWAAFQGWERASATPRTAWHSLEGVLWSVVVLLLLVAPCRVRPLLCNRVLVVLGVLSYSIYLIHFPVLIGAVNAVHAKRPVALQGWTPLTLVVMAGVALVTVALSAVTYRVIERPFLVKKAHIDG